MRRYQLYIIIGIIVTAAILYYIMGRDTVAIDAKDADAYKQLYTFLQKAGAPQWMFDDIKLYMPGGARDNSTWLHPDVGGKISKTGRLKRATDELPAKPYEFITIAVYQFYSSYLAQANGTA